MADGAEKGGKRALVTLAFGLVPAAAALVIVYGSYVGWTTEYQVTRSYRSLATLSREITARLQGLVDDVTTTARAVKGGTVPRPGQRPLMSCGDEPGPVLVDLGAVSIQPSPGAGEGRLRLAYEAQKEAQATSSRRGGQCRSVDAGEILSVDDLPMFDDVFLADRSGHVVASAGRAAGYVENLGPLVKPTGTTRPTTGIRSRLTFSTSESAGRPSRWGDAIKTPVEVVRFGRSYRLFCQSVEVPGAKTKLDVCGLRGSDAMAAAAWKIPPSLIEVAVCMTLGVILAWPLLKLRFMGPSERLRMTDVRLLVLSCLAGVGLVTFLVARTYGHQALQTRLDADSEMIGGELGRRFVAEVCAAAAQIGPLETTVVKDGRACEALGTAVYPRATAIAVIDPGGTVTTTCGLAKSGAGGGGAPVIVRAPRPTRSAGSRRYFKDASAHRLWSLPTCSGGPRNVAVESVRALTTGEATVAVAAPIRAPGKAGVAVVVGSFASVIDPVLPMGLQFAVLDEDGRVLLHSDSHRNLEENFVEETDQDDLIREALTARRTIRTDVSYYGHSQRVVMQPILQTPWSVAVIRDRAREATVTAVTSIAWLVSFGLYLFAWVVVFAFLAVISPGSRATWLWPNQALSGRYPVAIGLIACVVVVSGLAVTRGEGGGIRDLCLVLGLPCTVLGTVYLTFASVLGRSVRRRGLAFALTGVSGCLLAVGLVPHHGPWTSMLAAAVPVVIAGAASATGTRTVGYLRSQTRVSFVGLLTLILVATAALPSLVLFRDAYEHALAGFIKWAQLDYGTRLIARARNLGPGSAEALGAYVSEFVGLEPAWGEAVTPCAPGPPSMRERAVRWLVCGNAASAECDERAVAVARHPSAMAIAATGYYPNATGLDLMAFDAASDAGWCWTPSSSAHAVTLRIAAHLAGDDDDGRDRELSLTGSIPVLGRPQRLIGMLGWMLVGLAGLALLYLVLRTVVTRLFLLDPTGRDDVAASSHVQPRSGPPVWVHVAPAGTSLRTIVDATDAVHVIDLRDLGSSKDCEGIATANLEAKVVVVDHLEMRLTGAWSEAVVSLLETLVFHGAGTVVVLSEIDALDYLSDQFSHSEPTDVEGRRVVDLFWRWVQVFATCAVTEEDACLFQASRGPVAERIAMKAEPSGEREARYWRTWAQSTKAEKLAMRQLAQEGLLNPNAQRVARRLERRGLIVADPAFRFVDERFRRFVMRAEPGEDIQVWEREGASGWRHMQVLLVAAVLIVIGLLFLTQPEAYAIGMAVLAALTTGVPRLLEVAGLIGARRASGSAPAG
jgi:hypothetical protein